MIPFQIGCFKIFHTIVYWYSMLFGAIKLYHSITYLSIALVFDVFISTHRFSSPHLASVVSSNCHFFLFLHLLCLLFCRSFLWAWASFYVVYLKALDFLCCRVHCPSLGAFFLFSIKDLTTLNRILDLKSSPLTLNNLCF